MTEDKQIDRLDQLQTLMSQAGIKTLKELCRLTGTSHRTINKLRSGQIDTMQWQTLLKISNVFQISVDELVRTFSNRVTTIQPEPTIDPVHWQQEYDRLYQQCQQQRETLELEFQHQSLQRLESFLTYYPTAKHAATNNPDFPTTKILPLLKPIEQLITHWGVHPIGRVGEEIPYDPQFHQLIDGNANPGDLVRVRYLGYRQGDKLLWRAKVGC
jgi:transcriptional regulator with XRE-family HTH domain